jgi:hypothetical protein
MGPKKKKPLEESVWDDEKDGPFEEVGGEVIQGGDAG